MGFVLSKVLWFWIPAGYDVPDPATGITPRQRDIVQNTWKIIRTDARKHGIELFMKFFEVYPEYQQLFKGFAGVSRSDLPRNGKLLAHAMSVMYALNSVVDNLSDPECLVEVLKKTGVSHRTRNVNRQHFTNLVQVLISFLKDTLGTSVIDETAEEAWRKTLEVAISIIISSLEGKEDS